MIREGSVERIRQKKKTDPESNVQQFGNPNSNRSIGSLHFLRCDPAFSTVKCRSEKCVAYTLRSDEFQAALKSSPTLSEGWSCRVAAARLAFFRLWSGTTGRLGC